MPGTVYADNHGKFYQVEVDDQGKYIRTIGEADPVVATRWLVESFLAGEYRFLGEPVSAEEFASRVLLPAFNEIYGNSSGTFSERLEKLHQAYGDDVKIKRLVAGGIGSSEASAIWKEGMKEVAELTDASAESPPPNSGIENVQTSQGDSGPGGGGKSTTPGGKTPGGGATGTPTGSGTSESPAADGTQKTGGDPLILFSGSFFHRTTDLEVQGRGLHFQFGRTYVNQVVYKGPLGYQWDHSYNLWLREAQEMTADGIRRNVVYRSTGALREDPYLQVTDVASGELAPLSDTADAEFRGPPGYFDRLEKSGGRYVLETSAGLRFEYGDNLFIERIADRNGNAMRFEYDGLRLIRIVDPVGKVFSLFHDPAGRIAALRDETGGRQVLYYYDDRGDLIEVDLVVPGLTAGTDYRYCGPDHPFELQHSLTQIISPRGEVVVENEYGTQFGLIEFNRVIWQRSADGEFAYEYAQVYESDVDPSVDPVNVPVSVTRVQYPNGHVIEHTFNRQGDVVRRSEQILSSTGQLEKLEASYRYNPDGMMTREVHPDGWAVEYHHQRELYAETIGDPAQAGTRDRLSFGNLLRIVRFPRQGDGELRRIVSEFTYDAFRKPTSAKGPYYADLLLSPLPGQAIPQVFWDYDARGNLLRTRYPELLNADGTVHVVAPIESRYNDHGLVVESINGPLRTEIHYFEDALRSGFVSKLIRDPDGARLVTLYDVDVLGRITSATNPYGADIIIEWTPFNKPARVSEPAMDGGVRPQAIFQYDTSRRLVRIERELYRADGSRHPDRSAVETRRYDRYDRLIETSLGSLAEPLARRTRLTYYRTGSIEKVIDPRGNVTRYEYDVRERLAAITRGYGSAAASTQRFRYGRAGELIETQNGRGFKTRFEHDPFVRFRSATDPDGTTIERDHDASGRVVRERTVGIHPIEARSVRWSERAFKYDAIGRLIETGVHRFIPGQEEALPRDEIHRTTYFWDPAGRLERAVDPLGQESRAQFDALGRVQLRRDAAGNEEITQYHDAERRVTTIVTETGRADRGAEIRHVFRTAGRIDSQGRVIESTDAAGCVTRMMYDSRGLQSRCTHPDGTHSENEFDVFGRPVLTKTPSVVGSVETRLIYNAAGLVEEHQTPNGGRCRYDYDGLNRLVRETRSDGTLRTFEYHADGGIHTARNENGVIVRVQHSPGGRVVRLNFDGSGFVPLPSRPEYRPDGVPGFEFEFTPSGRLAQVSHGDHHRQCIHDSRDGVIEEITDGRSVRWEYDAVGRRIAMTYPNGRRIGVDYTPVGAVRALRQESIGEDFPGDRQRPASRTLFKAEHVGLFPLRMRFDTSHEIEMARSVGGGIAGMDWRRRGEANPVRSERVIYGRSGELRVQQTQEFSRLFRYDSSGHLTSAADYEGVAIADPSRFAPASSQTDLARSATQDEVDAALQAIDSAIAGSRSIRAFQYQVDGNGNRLLTSERLGPSSPVEERLFSASAEDQLQPKSGSRFLYDSSGNLLSDGTHRYQYDLLNRLTVVEGPHGRVAISRDAAGRIASLVTPKGRREFGYAGNRLIEWRANGRLEGQLLPLFRPNQWAQVATGGAEFTPVLDWMDSVVGWLDQNGTRIGDAIYDPFGQRIKSNGEWPAPFGFAGFLEDELSPLYHLPARVYQPGLGRFLQRDPMGYVDGSNLYSFARHAPGTLTDWQGFDSDAIDLGIAGLGIVTGLAAKVILVAAVASGGFLLDMSLTGIIGAGFAFGTITGVLNHLYKQSLVDRTAPGDVAEAVLLGIADQSGIPGLIQVATGRDIDTGAKLTKKERSELLASSILDAVDFGVESVGLVKSIGRPRAPKLAPPATADLMEYFEPIDDFPTPEPGQGFKVLVATNDPELVNAVTETAGSMNLDIELLPSKGAFKNRSEAAVATHGVTMGKSDPGAFALELWGEHVGPVDFVDMMVYQMEFKKGSTLMLPVCSPGVYSKQLKGTFIDLAHEELKLLGIPHIIGGPTGPLMWIKAGDYYPATLIPRTDQKLSVYAGWTWRSWP